MGHRGTWLAALFLLVPLHVSAEPVTESWLTEAVKDVAAETGVIALGAGVATSDGLSAIAVSGKTHKGSDTPVEAGDAWHLGSNTKALKALLYARLVHEGDLAWGASVASLFPDFETIAPGWEDVTIEDLLSHRAGAGQFPPFWLNARHLDDAPLTGQRLETARKRLSDPPDDPGDFEYSNLGYVIAGAAIEQHLDMSWEDAMQAYVFGEDFPVWRAGWDFGPPPDGLVGHKKGLFGLGPAGRGAGADNPQAMGPAGTLHAPLESHLLLLREYLRDDSAFLPAEQRDKLLTPWPDETANYALGWGVTTNEHAGRVYAHQGSNTMWLSQALIAPELDLVLVVNTNEMSDRASQAVRTLTGAILERAAAGTED